MRDTKEKIILVIYGIFKCFCRTFCYTIFRMRIQGLENIPRNGGFLLLSNHQSFLDPLFAAVPVYRRVHFVARGSLFFNKYFAVILKCCLVIPIKRGQADMSAIKEILRTLKAGHGVGIFPEATRTRDGKIIDVKPGFGLLVKKSKAPVIPVIIEGAFECWPRTRTFFLPGEIMVYYGKPITHEETENMDSDTFATFLTDKLRKNQNECRKAMGKEPFDYPQLPLQQSAPARITELL